MFARDFFPSPSVWIIFWVYAQRCEWDRAPESWCVWASHRMTGTYLSSQGHQLCRCHQNGCFKLASTVPLIQLSYSVTYSVFVKFYKLFNVLVLLILSLFLHILVLHIGVSNQAESQMPNSSLWQYMCTLQDQKSFSEPWTAALSPELVRISYLLLSQHLFFSLSPYLRDNNYISITSSPHFRYDTDTKSDTTPRFGYLNCSKHPLIQLRCHPDRDCIVVSRWILNSKHE
jgi:hypothetical protein